MATQLRIFESYLNDEDLELFCTTSDDDLVHVWGTPVDGTWRNVERNDIALVYHDGAFVARGQSSNVATTPTLRSISGEKTLKRSLERGKPLGVHDLPHRC